MTMRRIIVLRNSPDWRFLADKLDAEGYLDPKLYLPDPLPEGFPADTEQIIGRWNKLFPQNFFAARQAVKDMALDQLQRTGADSIIPQSEFESDVSEWSRNAIIFFTDDDDFPREDLFDVVEPHLSSPAVVRWPSPALGERLTNRRVEKYFPYLRFRMLTLARNRPNKLGVLATLARGRCDLAGAYNREPRFLVVTNNAAWNLSGLAPDRVKLYIDHVSASNTLLDREIPLTTLPTTYLSFANKLPTSITQLRGMLDGSDSDQDFLRRFQHSIAKFADIDLPEELAWMRPQHTALSRYYTKLSRSALADAGP